MADRQTDLTQLLQQPETDEEQLLELVYEELRVLAHSRMAQERPGLTLQTTALVHEAWMRMAGPDGERLAWENRAHFFGAAAIAMRRILVERSRRVRRERHGGLHARQPLEAADALGAVDAELDADGLDFERLDGALERLAARDEQAARVVDLRFFAGLSVDETAMALRVSPRTVAREWSVARAFVSREMSVG